MGITLPSGRVIGDSQPPFIIAEVGSNWLTQQDCLESISQAKKAGADAVKFQLYDEKGMYGFERPKVICYDSHSELDEPYWDEVKLKGKLPVDWLPNLKSKSDSIGIEFMCSAFSPELSDEVNKYVNIHKVASAEMTHVRLLERIRAYGKPVVLSTGASGLSDIRGAIQVLGETPTVLMYCVAGYPAKIIHLEMMNILRDAFSCYVGYSDHSTDAIMIPRLAAALNACVIEKHFCLDRISGTPDAEHSLNQDQFKDMIKYMFESKKEFGPSIEERDMVRKHNRRLIAIKDIKVGEKLIEGENFGIYRSLRDDSHAFSPFQIDNVNQKLCVKDVVCGNGIGLGDI